MEKIYEFRDELMSAKLRGFVSFDIHNSKKWINIDEIIKEIDDLRVCSCPPTVIKD
jgi:hypothetical protein|tara:strand:- start:3854 stop:4021 length:168 start_codon:yes stop_codon:yes gene_type:complete